MKLAIGTYRPTYHDRAGRFASIKSAFRKLWFYTKVSAAVIAMLAVAAFAGYAIHGNTLDATNQITIVQTQPQGLAPVMQRILQAESGNHQLNPKNGQVLIHINTNGTVDLGVAQINSIWFATATKLGYDLTKEKDNIAFANWLYENKGTGAWSSSSSSWDK